VTGRSPDPSAGGAEPLLAVRDLRVHFPITRGVVFRRTVGTVRAVDGVTLDVYPGETVGLVGESGSGKSTLGRAIVRLYRPTSGSIVFRGVDLATLRGRDATRLATQLQMVFQDPYSSLDPRMSVGACIAEPLAIHRVGTRTERSRHVTELLSTVGLPARTAGRYPHEMSGGQRQRVGLARALALNPSLVVADEAVSALDVSVQAQILNLLQRLQRELRLTYLFIAHDLGIVRHISDRIAVMYLGQIVETAGTDELHANPVHPYSIALLSAIPRPDPETESRRTHIVLPGDPPSPAAPPTGCRFHTRCWLRHRLGDPERCATEAPELRASPSGVGHSVACHFADESRASPERASVLLEGSATR
jgi:oligopeptide/dipeptide ABC transporter ATP-binding protein